MFRMNCIYLFIYFVGKGEGGVGSSGGGGDGGYVCVSMGKKECC